MREISPAAGMSPDEYLQLMVLPSDRQLVATIREQKSKGTRPSPSASLVDRSSVLERESRAALLDKVAGLVDENLSGRADMCLQFADLLHRALGHLGFPAQGILGTAIYYDAGREIFRWSHAWVRIGREVVDGNVDSLFENPMVPSSVKVAPYWGPINETPLDRHLRQDKSLALPPDEDVEGTWWPDLVEWLDSDLPGAGA